ncbi:MAG: septum formation inhibitor Maf [Ruminiclostridium sp.]|nr:septum formation inhibitor Maf [Ruminiclostridium sp.]
MLILASKSPRRIELLKLGGFNYEIIPALSEEKADASLTPSQIAVNLACQKAREVSANYKNDTVIGADTIVVCDGEIMGKPIDKDDAFRMLSKLSGNIHSVITGVCIKKGDKESYFYEETKVQFYPLSQEEINDYIATGEPMDKAGAYGIQEKGSLLVKKIDGDYFNVVGLPLSRFVREYMAFNNKN